MYTPLYIKTNNSLLESMIKIDELVDFAIKNNIKSLTITDNNMYGVMEFYKKCISNKIKPIIGLEIRLDVNLVLYAINYNGYKNLIKLSTIQSERPLLIADLALYKDNLICIVPFNSLGSYQTLEGIYSLIYKGYSNNTEKKELNGNNLVYMNETLYINNSENEYINYLYAIKKGTTVDKIKRDTKNNHIVLSSIIEKHFKEDIKNNIEITSMCNVEIVGNTNLLPVYDCPNDKDSFSYLKELCKNGLKDIFGERVNKIYIERLKYELDIIEKMGFCDYFLVVWDFVKYAKDKGILIGPGRGSAAGSLVSYCLNITTIDPIKYNLLFERFLNPERITMPDIDIDFDAERREEVINYCIKKYGIKKVVPIIAFGTLGSKQAIRDVGRVMDIDLKIIDFICKQIDSNLSLTDNINGNNKLKEYIKLDEELEKLYEVATKFEGLKRHTTIHAAGIVMSNVDIDEVIPLDKGHCDFYTTAYSMDYLEELGLLKMDFLAIKNLTIISNILKDINTDLTFDSIPENDDATISLFTDVNTLGIFQFESRGMMNFLRKFKPNNFEDIFAAIALFRPGPMQNIDSYIKRKHNLETIDYLDDTLKGILMPTYGIIVYQEQIMQIANIMAKYSLGEADVLRRAMSKKKEEVLIKEKEKFIDRSINNGYSSETSLKVFELILKFASYGFNRSHSVAYSMVAYKMAYLKVHHPKVFMKHLLNNFLGSEIKTKEYIHECKLNNINILKPDINTSSLEYEIINNGIIFPFLGIKNVGGSAANSIIVERSNKEFIDIYDFFKRCFKNISRKIIENLIYAGCFDSFNINRRTIINNLEELINYSELSGGFDDSFDLRPELEYFDEYSQKEILLNEYNVFGFYLSNHPVTEYKLKEGSISTDEVSQFFDKNIEIIVLVDRMHEVTTKKNEKMLFITGSDEIDNIDIILFPSVYKEYMNIVEGYVIKVYGKVEKRFDKYQIIVNSIKVLN